MKRIPILLLVAGLCVKGLLVLALRFSHAPELLNLLTTYDPCAFAFAENTVSLLFDPRRIAPTPSEAVAFDLLLILGFGLECMLVGFLVQIFLHYRRVDSDA